MSDPVPSVAIGRSVGRVDINVVAGEASNLNVAFKQPRAPGIWSAVLTDVRSATTWPITVMDLGDDLYVTFPPASTSAAAATAVGRGFHWRLVVTDGGVSQTLIAGAVNLIVP